VGQTIRTSITPWAFQGGSSGVTIKRLAFKWYASPSQSAVVGFSSAQSWIVDSNWVSWSHGIGIRPTGSGAMQRWNRVHHMGQLGIATTGTNVLIYGNQLDSNMTAYFGAGSGEECGASKFVSTTGGLIVRKNNVFDNLCNGLWNDTNNQDVLIDSNTVTGNAWTGIIDEVGYRTIIRANTVSNNGSDPHGSAGSTTVSPAEILIANSRNAEVDHNIVTAGASALGGITGYDSDRPSPTLPAGEGTHDVVGMNVHDNTITMTNANRAGGVADNDAGTGDPYSVAANNQWTNNTYTLGASTRFKWANANHTWATWHATDGPNGTGEDIGSTESGQ